MPKINHYTKIGLFILAIGHLTAAYFSFGYHHPDEHYQILEWAHYFIGLAPDASHLPWEFGAQIRPWFQPMLHAIFMKESLFLGSYDPFKLAFFFRLAYAALNIWSVIALWNYFQKKYELSSKWFVLLSLLWFFPYMHVRTSSENLAGIFLSFALLTLAKARDAKLESFRPFYQAGLLFGFAFLARYQIALGLLGLGIALLISDQGFKKKHALLITGFLVSIGLGVLLDRWGYGNWVFTPYQYFKVNLLDHVADRYNPYPWYQYFLWILQLNPLISLPLFYGWVRFSNRNKIDVFTSFTVSFFILHCFITNKEYRFLLPILNVVPFMAIAYFQTANLAAFPESFFKRLFWAPAFVVFYVFVNLISFGVSTLHGASTQAHWAVHAVDRHFKDYPHAVWLSNRDYLHESENQFYNLKMVPGFEPHELHIYHSGEELLKLLQEHPNANVLIDGNLRDSITSAFVSIVESSKCTVITRAFPKFVSQRMKVNYQALYECKGLHSL